jgi:CPA2 family monovalent cation:H+ antiporter-2
MGPEGLGTVLILLAAVVAVVAAVRRLHLPPILGYLAVGMGLGPHAFGVVRESATTSFLAELGVVFLLFTLGLEFSWPRMVAMRREVVGLGAMQVGLTTLVAAAIAVAAGAPTGVAVVIGGAAAMSSTAIVLQQLTEQAEINRTHGRLAFSILLFQDLVFVLFLAIANAIIAGGAGYGSREVALALGEAAVALLVVLAAGRWLARPLFFEIARSKGQELFTLAVLLVALTSAWITYAVGLSLALGGFLAGMLLAETEYRHQVEAVIRPFRDVLLGVFFITIGMLLDLRLLGRHFLLVSTLVVGLAVLKTLVVALVARRFCDSWFKSLRAGLVVSGGGEFGQRARAAAARRGHVQHGAVAVRDPPQQADRALAAGRAGPDGNGCHGGVARSGRRCRARASRARDPVRLRPRRPEHRAGPRAPRPRIHRHRPRAGARAYRPPGR